MTDARLPFDEPERLMRLRQLGVLDTAPDPRFDALTLQARALFHGAEMSAVSLVDAERQWFKSAQGLDVRETPRAVSFCAHAILGNRVFVVEDAARDKRFADNALVTGAPGIRFYAGAPLLNGLGSLCVIGTAPRRVTAAELEGLTRLARQVDAQLLAHGALHTLHRD